MKKSTLCILFLFFAQLSAKDVVAAKKTIPSGTSQQVKKVAFKQDENNSNKKKRSKTMTPKAADSKTSLLNTSNNKSPKKGKRRRSKTPKPPSLKLKSKSATTPKVKKQREKKNQASKATSSLQRQLKIGSNKDSSTNNQEVINALKKLASKDDIVQKQTKHRRNSIGTIDGLKKQTSQQKNTSGKDFRKELENTVTSMLTITSGLRLDNAQYSGSHSSFNSQDLNTPIHSAYNVNQVSSPDVFVASKTKHNDKEPNDEFYGYGYEKKLQQVTNNHLYSMERNYSAQNKIHELKAEIYELSQRVDDLEKPSPQQQDNIQQTTQKLQNQQTAFEKELQQQKNKHSQVNNQLQKELQEVKNQLQQQKNKHSQLNNQLQKELQKVKNQLQQQKKEINKLSIVNIVIKSIFGLILFWLIHKVVVLQEKQTSQQEKKPSWRDLLW